MYLWESIFCDQAGQTAADIAMKDGHPEIANLLIRVKQVHDCQ